MLNNSCALSFSRIYEFPFSHSFTCKQSEDKSKIDIELILLFVESVGPIGAIDGSFTDGRTTPPKYWTETLVAWPIISFRMHNTVEAEPV